MLTTLRSVGKEGFFIDITVKEDGSVAKSIGPLHGEHLARRWERFMLIRHRAWEELFMYDTHDSAARQEVSSFSLEMLVTETDEVTTIASEDLHDRWMEEHPLEMQHTFS